MAKQKLTYQEAGRRGGIVAPSNGRVHESGGAYEIVSGSPDTIAIVTPDERRALLDLARTFDEMPAPPPSLENTTATGASGDHRPGDDFNEQTTWSEILHGWQRVYPRGETDYWRRPGKTIGISASTNHGGSDCLYVFSTSTIFEPGRSYTKFGAYAVLEHGGDFTAAAKELAGRGFGKQSRNLPVRPNRVEGEHPESPNPWKLVRVETRPPLFNLYVDDVVLELTPAQLLQAGSIRTKALEAGIFWRYLDKDTWANHLGRLHADIEVEDPPDDASEEGLAWAAIRQFLLTAIPDEHADERRLWPNRAIYRGDIVLTNGEAIAHQLRIRYIKLDPRKCWAVFKDHGGRKQNLRIGGTETWCWTLPRDRLES